VKVRGSGVHLLHDDRLPKRPSNAHNYFMKERFESGDMKGVPAKELYSKIYAEWKVLPAAEKKVSKC